MKKLSYNIIEQVALAADNFITNGRTYTNLRITPETRVDDVIETLYQDFGRRWASIDKTGMRATADSFLLLSKWNLYKTIYKFDEDFYQAVVDTKDTKFHQASLKNIPVKSFFVACPQPGLIGFFVYIEFLENETFFFVSTVDAVKGSMMHMGQDTMWIEDGQRIGDALTAWHEATKTKKDHFNCAYENMNAAIQIAYYLSAQNSVLKKINTSKEKRPKRLDGKPFNLRQWEVGYRLGCDYIKSKGNNSAIKDVNLLQSIEKMQERGTSPKPHIRRAHWHHYWVGEGKTKLILKWIEPVWVNGSEDEIIATGHRVLH